MAFRPITIKNRDFVTHSLQLRIAREGANSNPLFDELDYWMNLDREDDPSDPYDLCDALFDVENQHEQEGGDKKVLRMAREALIEFGYYREISAEELSQWTSNRGKVTCNFRLNKKMYWADDSSSCWMDGFRS